MTKTENVACDHEIYQPKQREYRGDDRAFVIH